MAFITAVPAVASSLANRSSFTCSPSRSSHSSVPSSSSSSSSSHYAAAARMCAAAATTSSDAGTSSTASNKTTFNVTLLPGDGIGPEIMQSTVSVLQALEARFSIRFNFTTELIGGCALDATSIPFPSATLAQCKASDSILLACIGGPKWDDFPRPLRPESGLLALRRELDLFANLRPAKVLPQLIGASTLKPDVIDGVDIMVVRELTSDVYFGTPKGIDVRTDGSGKRIGYNNMKYTEEEVERIAHVAYKTARKRNSRVVSVDKANVLDVSQLWRDVVTSVGKNYEDVQLSHMYVDNAAMQLIRCPKQFDTIVTGNIFGDILSDAASMLVGSLGMLPSASLGGSTTDPGVFEPVHGSAPDIAGENKANPAACILSAAMMMRYDLNRPDIADVVEAAVDSVLDDGVRTGDIMSEAMTLVGCKQFGDAVVAKLAS